MPKKKTEDVGSPLKNYIVPMRWEFRGHADVEATSAEEARTKAIQGRFDNGVVLFEAGAELINWEVTGEPKEDK